jgi:hypothetical protein
MCAAMFADRIVDAQREPSRFTLQRCADRIAQPFKQ